MRVDPPEKGTRTLCSALARFGSSKLSPISRNYLFAASAGVPAQDLLDAGVG